MPVKNPSLVALALALLNAPAIVARLTCTTTQITDSPTGQSFAPSLDGGAIAFASDADLTGGNPDGTSEIFLFHGGTITQITNSATDGSFAPSLDGGAIAFGSDAVLTGGNPDHSPPGTSISRLNSQLSSQRSRSRCVRHRQRPALSEPSKM